MASDAMNAPKAQEVLRRLIDQHRDEIERHWLDRVQHDVAKKPGVELTELRNAMPRYIAELVNALAGGAESFDHGAESAWSSVAREHGITRVRIGFDISQLVHEFIVLRRIIGEVGRESEPDFAEAEGLLPDLLEPAIAVAVQAYVDARDYESRRAEAAHIGFLTHELRNPLTAARLAAGRVRRLASDGQAGPLDRLDRALSRLDSLIDSVLLTERLEAGAVRTQPEEIPLGQLMEPVEALGALAGEKGLSFRMTYEAGRMLRLDPKLTQSAIQNLAENAVKYTDAGGVDVVVTVNGDELAVDVRDTCGGLSAEELKTIFEPFKRGHTEKTGTGLGLAIARRAIEVQGGSIQAESQGTSGCHFSVRIPMPPVAPKRPEWSTAPTSDPVAQH
jgi:signal transduction histidine kinase